jgi:hypothetical protein
MRDCRRTEANHLSAVGGDCSFDPGRTQGAVASTRAHL